VEIVGHWGKERDRGANDTQSEDFNFIEVEELVGVYEKWLLAYTWCLEYKIGCYMEGLACHSRSIVGEDYVSGVCGDKQITSKMKNGD